MLKNSEETIRTRMTLIERLKHLDDHESWEDFHRTYRNLLFGVAIRSGLSQDEAKEAVQETLISVTKNIGKFKADPAFGSFKSWLLQLTRWRIANQIRKRPKEEVGRVHKRRDNHTDTASTATEERVADPDGNMLDAIWEEEWREDLKRAALEKLKRRVPARQFQIFHAYVIEGLPVGKVGKLLGVSVGQAYLAKYRLTSKFRDAVKEVEAERG